MTYLVTAFRWGWLNNHSYNLYCGSDFRKAFETAEEEAEDRAGKYGVVVHRFDDGENGEQDQELIGYFPSSWGEKLPYHNYKLDYYSTLGHMMEEYADGIFYEVQEGGSVLQKTAIEPDPRIVDRVRKRKEFYDALQSGDITRGEDDGTR